MEMEDEKTADSNSVADDNLSDDENEITIEGEDFDDFDFDVIAEEEEEGADGAESVVAEIDLGDSDFDLATEDDKDLEDENPGFENDDALDNLLALEESDLLNIDIEEPLDDTEDYEEATLQDDFLHKFDDDDLSPLSFAGKQIIIFGMAKEHADLLNKYLSERAGMEVECVSKKENLWRFLKIDPLDLIILETGTEGNSDGIELMQQTKDQFPEVHFICVSGPVSLERRLHFLNAGALDYLTRPLHLSTVAQSILVQFSHNEIYDDDDFADLVADAHDIPEEEPIIDSAEILAENNSGGTSLPDEDLKLAEEIELIDEDF